MSNMSANSLTYLCHELVNLWKDAQGKLSQEDRHNLDTHKTSLPEVRKALDRAQKSHEADENQSEIVIGKKTFSLRDIAGRIISPSIGSSSSSTMPSPWIPADMLRFRGPESSSFCKLSKSRFSRHPTGEGSTDKLQLPLSEFERYSTVTDGMATITNVISYSAHFEDLYLEQPSRVLVEFREALIEMYRKALKFLSKAMHFYDKGGFTRLVTSWIKSKTEFPDIIEDIKGDMKIVNTWARLVDRETLKDVAGVANALKLSYGQRTDRDVLTWISHVPYMKHHAAVSSCRLPDTGLWLLKHKSFTNWRNSTTSSILWLHGRIGTGKTTLMSLVIDGFLDKKLMPMVSDPVLFFYCNREQEGLARQDPREVLRSLVRQLVFLKPGEHIEEPVKSKYDELEKQERKLSLDDSVELIIKLIENYQSVTIVIDGLDECDVPTNRDTSSRDATISRLLAGFKEIMKISPCLVKILVSSRKYDRMESLLDLEDSQTPQIAADENSSDDIARFVQCAVEDSQNNRDFELGKIPFDLEKHIITTLTNRAEGMFLWVSLKLRRLKDMADEKDVWKELEFGHLPKGLSPFYDDDYEKITQFGDYSSTIAHRALKLLFCGQKQLPTSTFLEAAFGPDNEPHSSKAKMAKNLIRYCRGFVVQDEAMDVFRFAHTSVPEYLELKKDYEIKAHEAAAELCLEDLHKTRERGRSRKRRDSFSMHRSKRSTSRPGSRARSSSATGTREEYFVGRRRSSSATGVGLRRSASGTWEISGIDTIIIDPTAKIPIVVADQPVQGFHDYATLYWATHCTLSGRQKMLPDLKALLEASDAFEQWAFDAQKLLSQHPFGFYDHHVETKIEHSLSDPPDPFFPACVFGFIDLLKKYESDSGRSKTRFSIFLKLLRIEMPDANERGLNGLHIACKFGQKEVARTLLENEASVMVKDREGKTALHHAVENAEEGKPALELVNLLLRRDGERQVTNSVLTAAAKNLYCAKDLVRTLLSYQSGQIGVDVLEAAAGNGESAQTLVDLLLDEGPEIPLTGEVLTVAVQNPYCTKNLVESLLEPRGGIPVAEEVLVAAARCSNKQVVRKPTNRVERVPWKDRERIWKLLLGYGGGPQITEKVLEAATAAEDEELVKFLLEGERKVQVTHKMVETAAASMRCPHELVDILLGQPGNDQVTEKVLKTALENTAADKLLIETLWARGGNKNMRVTEETLEIIAANNEKGEELLQFLLKHDAKLEISENAIVTAALSCNSKMLKLLLAQGKHTPISEHVLKVVVAAGAAEGRVEATMEDSNYMAAIGQLQETEMPDVKSDVQDGLMKEIIQLMLDHSSMITRDIIEAAASSRGKRVMEFLLTRSKDDPIEISEAIAVAAARNRVYGDSVLGVLMKHVLSKQNSSLPITETMRSTGAAYGNRETVKLLLGDSPIGVSKKVFMAAASNSDSKVLDYLLVACEDLPDIDDDVLRSAAANSDYALQTLLKHPKSMSPKPICPELVQVTAEKCRQTESMNLLLAGKNAKKIITNDEIIAAAKNRHGIDMIRYLFEQNRRIAITTPMLEAAAGNVAFAPETLRVLFDRCESEELGELINEKVLQIAARNDGEAPEALKVLLLEDGVGQLVSETVLQVAACNNIAPEALKVLLEKDGVERKFAENLLHWAAKEGKEAVVKLLLERGADVDARDDRQWTALHEAATEGHEAVVQRLLEYEATVDAKDDRQSTALHKAAANGHGAVVQQLLKHEANVDTKDYDGWTALHKAAEKGHEMVVRLLLEHKANVHEKTKGTWTALHKAAGNGDEMVVRLLLEHQANVYAKDHDGWTALHKAAENGNEMVVRLLLEHQDDVDMKANNGWTALHWAARTGHETVVRLLLEDQANVDAIDNDGCTALHRATEHGNETVVRQLLDHQTNVNTKSNNGWTALHWAAGNGHEMVVRLLFEKGVDVELKDNEGETALHRVARNEHGVARNVQETVVRLLLERGADIKTKDNDGWTALRGAARNGYEAVVQLLLEKGADVNVRDNEGRTALHGAAGNGHTTVVQLLLERGADVKVEDDDGERALHSAAGNGHEAVVRLLIERGANVMAEDKKGYTALQRADRKRHKAAVRLLER